jgi:hypothetical protein
MYKSFIGAISASIIRVLKEESKDEDRQLLQNFGIYIPPASLHIPKDSKMLINISIRTLNFAREVHNL